MGKIFNRNNTEKALEIHEKAKDQVAFMMGESWVNVRQKQKIKAEERRMRNKQDKLKKVN